MSEVLVQFDEPQSGADGQLFVAQIHGARTIAGIWEGWIEFHPHDGGEPVCTTRETEQLSRGDLRYWAAGLSRAYLAGALIRALSPTATAIPGTLAVPEIPPSVATEHMVLETSLLRSEPALLDPDELYRRSGEYVLRQELRALDAMQLRDIIAGCNIDEMDVTDLARTFEDALVERIVACVQHRALDLVPQRASTSIDSTK